MLLSPCGATTTSTHAVVEQELGGLEALGQVLADGLLDHPRAREPDHRARLGQDHVAEHREARAHAAGGRDW